MEIDTVFLDLSNKVANHPKIRANTQGGPASALVSAGARYLGFAQVAVGLAAWTAEPDGIAQMQSRLANQQFDTMHLAPISFVASAAISCLDVCAAATYRLYVGPPPRSRERDLNTLGNASLPEGLVAWKADILADLGYKTLLEVRHQMIHRAIPSHSFVGSGPGYTKYAVQGQERSPKEITAEFAALAERHYRTFITAVLADFV